MCLDLIIAMDYGMLPCEVSSKHTNPQFPIVCLKVCIYFLLHLNINLGSKVSFDPPE